MGYASGSGLGKNRDGPINSLSIPYNNSRKGFGLDLPNIEHINISWDFSKEVYWSLKYKCFLIYLCWKYKQKIIEILILIL